MDPTFEIVIRSMCEVLLARGILNPEMPGAELYITVGGSGYGLTREFTYKGKHFRDFDRLLDLWIHHNCSANERLRDEVLLLLGDYFSVRHKPDTQMSYECIILSNKPEVI